MSGHSSTVDVSLPCVPVAGAWPGLNVPSHTLPFPLYLFLFTNHVITTACHRQPANFRSPWHSVTTYAGWHSSKSFSENDSDIIRIMNILFYHNRKRIKIHFHSNGVSCNVFSFRVDSPNRGSKGQAFRLEELNIETVKMYRQVWKNRIVNGLSLKSCRNLMPRFQVFK